MHVVLPTCLSCQYIKGSDDLLSSTRFASFRHSHGVCVCNNCRCLRNEPAWFALLWHHWQMYKSLQRLIHHFHPKLKRCLRERSSSLVFFHSVIHSTYMHSTQLSELASNLIGQGRHNREESGLMAEQRGKDNELITVWKKSEQRLVLETNPNKLLTNQLACQPHCGTFKQSLILNPAIAAGKLQQWIKFARGSLYFLFSCWNIFFYVYWMLHFSFLFI